MIRDSRCWDRRTLKRGALHRKKLGPNGSNFTGAQARSTQYLEKFYAEMTHIWPGIWLGGDGLADGLIVPGPQAMPVRLSAPPSDAVKRCHGLHRDQFGVDDEPSCNDSKSGPQ
jgi:hypothetical protein